jgi:hypothetical protein
MSSKQQSFKKEVDQSVDENPYAPSPSVVDMSPQPSIIELCLSVAPGWLRRMFQSPVAQEDDRIRLHNAYRAFFRLNPETVHLAVTAHDPASLLSKEPLPAGAEVHALCKQSIDHMPGALVLFWSHEDFDDKTRPLLERCAFFIVPKSQSSELRKVVSSMFSEEVASKIISMKSMASVFMAHAAVAWQSVKA